jgi:hypothetical protein
MAAAMKGRNGKASIEPEEKVRADNAEMLAAVTESWLLCDFNGMPIDDDCNKVNALELYGTEATEWIAFQVMADLAEEANFIQA